MYLDDPDQLVNKHDFRYSIVLAIDIEVTPDDIQDIISQDANWKYLEPIPDSNCLRATFPRKNGCSDMFADRTYGQFEKYWNAHHSEKPQHALWEHVYVERYDHDDGRNEYYCWFENEETHRALLGLTTKTAGPYKDQGIRSSLI